jgi:hypothetical protein
VELLAEQLCGFLWRLLLLERKMIKEDLEAVDRSIESYQAIQREAQQMYKLNSTIFFIMIGIILIGFIVLMLWIAR